MKNPSPDYRPWRILNPDGTFNVAKTRRRNVPWEDSYHSALTMRWGTFFLFLFFAYLFLNLFFAAFYFLIGAGAVEGAGVSDTASRFVDDFFFSVQTFSTIGYGKMAPNGIWANLLVTVEALTGMISVAMVAGVLFARFSRPTARVLFSKRAIIGPHNGMPALTIRMANERLNEILDAEVSVSVVYNTKTKEGQAFRVPNDLSLERAKSSIFAMSWTLIHTIDEKSPLHGKSKEDLENLEAEIIISLAGIDDTFSSSIHSRYSYLASDLIWNHRFDDMISLREDGKILVNLEKIHDTVPFRHDS